MRFPTLADLAPPRATASAVPLTAIARLELVYAVLVFLHIATLALGRGPIALTAYPVVAGAIALAIVRRRIVLSLSLAIALLFALWCIITNLVSPHAPSAHAFGRLAPLLVAFALTQEFPVRAFDTGLRLLLALTGIAAVYGVIQHFTGLNVFDARGVALKPALDGPRFLATGFHSIHNYLGMTASLWVAFAACLGLDAWRRGARRTFAFAVVSLALIGVLLLVSFGRAGWVAAFVALALSPLVVRVRRGFLFPIALSVAAGGLVATNPMLRTRLASVFSLAANADRGEILSVNLHLVAAMPWHGHGFGSYEKVAAPLHRALYPERPFWFGAHSDVFQVLIETGWFGLSLFALFWGAFFWTLSRRLWGRQRVPDDDRWRTGAAFLIGVAFLLCGITQTALKCFEAFSILAVAIAHAGPSRSRNAAA